MIYLDNAATTWKKPPGVMAAIKRALNECGGNPGRSSHALSLAAAEAIDSVNDIEAIDAAVAAIQGSDGLVNGVAMAPAFGAALGSKKMTDSGAAMYPEYRFGGNPASFAGGIASDVNGTVSFGTNQKLRAVVGDFANCFKWGFAENIPLEIIQYGDPDGQGDLKRTNEIVLRSEAYIGWGILDANSFALVKVNP